MKSLPSIYEVNLWFWFWSIYEAANLWSYFNRYLLSFLTPFDKKHIQNRHEEDFLNGGTSCSTVLKTEGAKFGLTLDAFNLLSCFGQADSLAEIRSSGGLSLWRDDDPVHLTVAAYGDIAEVLTTQAAATNQQPPVEEAGQRGAHAENQKDPCQRA